MKAHVLRVLCFCLVFSATVAVHAQKLKPILSASARWSVTNSFPGEGWENTCPLPGAALANGPFKRVLTSRSDGSAIWMTTELKLDGFYRPGPLTMRYMSDGVLEVYINGQKVLHRFWMGTAQRVAVLEVADNPLKPGRNVVAMCCSKRGARESHLVALELYRGKLDVAPMLDFSKDARHLMVRSSGVVRSLEQRLDLFPMEQCIYPTFTSEFSRNEGQQFAFSADGKRMCRAGADQVVRLWDVPTGEIIRELPVDSGTRADITPDGGKIITLKGSNIRVWDAETGEEVGSWGLPEAQTGRGSAVVVSPNGKLVAVTYGRFQSKVGVFDIEEEALVQEFQTDGKPAFSADCKRVGTTSGVWEVETGTQVCKWNFGGLAVWGFDWSPDGTLIAAGNAQGVVTIYDGATGELVRELRMDEMFVTDVAFSSDMQYLAAANMRGVTVWETATWTQVDKCEGGYSVAFIPQRRGVSGPAKVATTRPKTPGKTGSKPTRTAGRDAGEEDAEADDGPQNERVAKALNYLKIDEPKLAIETLKEAVEANTEDCQAEMVLGLYYFLRMNNTAEAFELFKTCVKKDRDNPVVLNNFGDAAVVRREYTLALGAWAKLAKTDPHSPELIQNVGLLMSLVKAKKINLDEKQSRRMADLYIAVCLDHEDEVDTERGYLFMPLREGSANRPDCDEYFTRRGPRGQQLSEPYEVKK